MERGSWVGFEVTASIGKVVGDDSVVLNLNRVKGLVLLRRESGRIYTFIGTAVQVIENLITACCGSLTSCD